MLGTSEPLASLSEKQVARRDAHAERKATDSIENIIIGEEILLCTRKKSMKYQCNESTFMNINLIAHHGLQACMASKGKQPKELL